jgi:hypothetical protein
MGLGRGQRIFVADQRFGEIDLHGDYSQHRDDPRMPHYMDSRTDRPLHITTWGHMHGWSACARHKENL